MFKTKFQTVFTLLISFLLISQAAAAAHFKIIHTSDTHGHHFDKQVTWDSKNKNKTTGGFASLASAKGYYGAILLDSGDWASGNYEVNNSGGLDAVKVMNALGYTATTVGNHEFDIGEKALIKAIKSFKFPVLNTHICQKDIKDKCKLLPGTKPYITFKADGAKVLVVGFGKTGPGAKNYEERNPVEEFEKILPKIQKEKADYVILMMHDSIADVRKPSVIMPVVQKYPDMFDLVIGGHAHKTINKQVEAKKLGFDYENLLFVESSEYLKGFTLIDVNVEPGTKNTTAKFEFLYTNDFPHDPKIYALTESYRNKDLDEQAGVVKETITKYSKSKKNVDSPMANMMADEIKAFAEKEFNTKIDFGIFNTPGVRMDLPAGPITGRTITEMYPYHEVIALTKVTGAFLKAVVENGLKDTQSIFEYSGLNVKYKYKGTDQNGTPHSVVIEDAGGNELVDQKLYTIAGTANILDGNYECYIFKENVQPIQYSKTDTMDLLYERVKKDTEEKGGVDLKGINSGRIVRTDKK
ncbi:2',3'-cyclic-nucleotide 2'-phosphodiesterase/3'-nucleotidase/5'-nucleotidase; bifunctional 2' [Elusimicrobium posterum]|uniref:bifunctional metallophosphatase/5'-nucleotidase n=1 Tax=Elusimicrobium posterum TaxID=3116653 RepID=UPI003C75AA48